VGQVSATLKVSEANSFNLLPLLMRMSDLTEASSRNNHPWIVQERADRLLAQLEQGHDRRRMALESHRVDQADRVVVDAITALLDPQSPSRPTLLWNRTHGDD